MSISTFKRKRRRRRGYHREASVYTHPAQVPGVIFRDRIRGNLCRGPQVITGLKKGAMTNIAVKKGYINEDQHVSDIPKSQMDNFGRDLAKTVGPTRATRMVNAQIILRKNEGGGFKDKMLIAKGAIQRKSKVLKVHR